MFIDIGFNQKKKTLCLYRNFGKQSTVVEEILSSTMLYLSRFGNIYYYLSKKRFGNISKN